MFIAFVISLGSNVEHQLLEYMYSKPTSFNALDGVFWSVDDASMASHRASQLRHSLPHNFSSLPSITPPFPRRRLDRESVVTPENFQSARLRREANLCRFRYAKNHLPPKPPHHRPTDHHLLQVSLTRILQITIVLKEFHQAALCKVN